MLGYLLTAVSVSTAMTSCSHKRCVAIPALLMIPTSGLIIWMSILAFPIFNPSNSDCHQSLYWPTFVVCVLGLLMVVGFWCGFCVGAISGNDDNVEAPRPSAPPPPAPQGVGAVQMQVLTVSRQVAIQRS